VNPSIKHRSSVTNKETENSATIKEKEPRSILYVEDAFGLVDDRKIMFDSEDPFPNGPIEQSIGEDLQQKDIHIFKSAISEQFLQICCEVQIDQEADDETIEKSSSSSAETDQLTNIDVSEKPSIRIERP
jgi:hypothetical protein